MGRWEPNPRERLKQAALELFAEQGFAATTVPQITARAGLTTRTFYRHFADKREALFDHEDELPGLVASLVAEAPPGMTPMRIIERGLTETAQTRFEGRLAELRTRQAVVQSDEGLREREGRKFALLSDSLRQALVGRGVHETTATIAAQLATSVFAVAVGRWLEQPGERPLTEFITEALTAMRSLAAG